MGSFATVVYVSKTADHTINITFKTLDERVVDMGEQAIIHPSKCFDSNNEKIFVRRAIRSDLKDVLGSFSHVDMKIRDSLQPAMVHSLGTKNLSKEAAKVLISYQSIVTLKGTYVVKMANKNVSQASKAIGSVVPLSPHLSRSDSFPSKATTNCSKQNKEISGRTRHRYKSSGASLATDTWSEPNCRANLTQAVAETKKGRNCLSPSYLFCTSPTITFKIC